MSPYTALTRVFTVCHSALLGHNLNLGLQIRVRNWKLFSYCLTKTYVVGTQKNLLNETVFEQPKHMLKMMGKYLITFLH